MLQALIRPIELLKKGFIALKAEVEKLGIIPTNLNDSETQIDDLVVGKLKLPVDSTKLSDVVDNEVQHTIQNLMH